MPLPVVSAPSALTSTSACMLLESFRYGVSSSPTVIDSWLGQHQSRPPARSLRARAPTELDPLGVEARGRTRPRRRPVGSCTVTHSVSVAAPSGTLPVTSDRVGARARRSTESVFAVPGGAGRGPVDDVEGAGGRLGARPRRGCRRTHRARSARSPCRSRSRCPARRPDAPPGDSAWCRPCAAVSRPGVSPGLGVGLDLAGLRRGRLGRGRPRRAACRPGRLRGGLLRRGLLGGAPSWPSGRGLLRGRLLGDLGDVGRAGLLRGGQVVGGRLDDRLDLRLGRRRLRRLRPSSPVGLLGRRPSSRPAGGGFGAAFFAAGAAGAAGRLAAGADFSVSASVAGSGTACR